MTQEAPGAREPPRDLPSDSRRPGAEAGGDHPPEAINSLKQAMRRARFDDAERVGVQAELRSSQIGRLELLQEALRPLLAQIPQDVDMFDIGIMPGTTPRLFIDMIGFVEMGRDARLYRLLQDTRHSRVTIAETAEIGRMVEAITDYVARRLIERDKALAAEAFGGADRSSAASPAVVASGLAPSTMTESKPSAIEPKPSATAISEPRKTGPSAPAGRWQHSLRWSSMAFAFVIDLLGATTLFTILAVVVWYLWNRLHGQV